MDNTGEITVVIKDTILSIAAIITSFVAITGIRKWKSELTGKTHFDVSFRLLKTVYGLRDRFANLRSAYMSPNETLGPDRNSSGFANENLRHVLGNRSRYFQETLNEFYSILPEVEALFGKEFKQLCWQINSLVWDYQDKVNSYVQLFGNSNNDEYLRELSNAVFSRPDNDPYKIKLDEIIAKIEKILSKHLSKKATR